MFPGRSRERTELSKDRTLEAVANEIISLVVCTKVWPLFSLPLQGSDALLHAPRSHRPFGASVRLGPPPTETYALIVYGVSQDLDRALRVPWVVRSFSLDKERPRRSEHVATKVHGLPKALTECRT